MPALPTRKTDEMKNSRLKCVLYLLAACIFSVTLGALFAPPSWRSGIYREVAPFYLKYCVDIPRGDDIHRFYLNDGYASPGAYIAHGGGVGQYVYNNSLEAAQDSIAQGFRFIEFDLIVTSDGHLVAGHSWEDFRKMAHLPVEAGPLSLAEVQESSRPGEFSPMVAKDICRLLEENPGLMVVTDKIADYGLLLKEIPYPDRLIVEVVGGVSGYQRAIKAGVRYPSLAVYDIGQMQLARDCRIPIVSLGNEHFFDTPEGIELTKEMHDMGITILLCDPRGDAAEFIRAHLGRSFSMIYTDSWSPAHLPQPAPGSASSQIPQQAG